MVAQPVRGSGVGRSLMAAAEHWAHVRPLCLPGPGEQARRPLLRSTRLRPLGDLLPQALLAPHRGVGPLHLPRGPEGARRRAARSTVTRWRGAVLVEQSEQPSGTRHGRPECCRPLAQPTVSGDQGHLVIGVGDDGDEPVVPAARRVHDRDSVVLTRLGALARLPLEDNDHGPGEPPRSHRGTYPLEKAPGCAGTIPPPAVGPGPDHICRVDEQHPRSLPERKRIRPHHPHPGPGRPASSRNALGGPPSSRARIASAHSPAERTDVSTSRS